MISKLLTSILLAVTFSAAAQNCENVIALSRIVSTSIADKSSVDQHAANFCSEYSKRSSSGSSADFGASYKFFSASFGNSNLSADEVASKVCSASSSNQASNDAYKQYVETISPNAYTAYQQCLNMTQSDIRFEVDVAAVLPAEFSVLVTFRADNPADNSARLSYVASSGITCQWGDTRTKDRTLQDKTSILFRCARQDQTKPGYVKVARTNGVQGSLTLPWIAYTKEGMPIATLVNIQTRIAGLEGQVTIAANAISAINGANAVSVYKCPTGNTPGWNPGGAWGSYGCQGQLSSSATCKNIEWPNEEVRTCSPIGLMRLY
jgi:hypothetical protein